MNIGERIRNLRKSRNISQQALANHLNINRNYLSRIETNTSEPTASIITSLSKLFNVSPESLLGIEHNGTLYEEKVKYVTENCKMLIESDLDFLIRVITIMKEEYVKNDLK